jgi:hypothetical protein
MLTGAFPFENVSDIITGSYKDPPNAGIGMYSLLLPKLIHSECCTLLRKMFQVDVSHRATLDNILVDPWVVYGPSNKNVKVVECTVVSTSNNNGNGTNSHDSPTSNGTQTTKMSAPVSADESNNPT